MLSPFGKQNKGGTVIFFKEDADGIFMFTGKCEIFSHKTGEYRWPKIVDDLICPLSCWYSWYSHDVKVMDLLTH